VLPFLERSGIDGPSHRLRARGEGFIAMIGHSHTLTAQVFSFHPLYLTGFARV
jgi:hypothetical protein